MHRLPLFLCEGSLRLAFVGVNVFYLEYSSV